DNNVIPTFSNLALGYPDNRRISLGISGWIVIDMLKPILNQPGIDFFVYENDNDPEGYFVYVSQNWNGPFYFCGVDTGNAGFDLSRGGLNWARYIKIVDDGDGSSSPTAGFDLDAIIGFVSAGPLLSSSLFGIIDTPPNGNNNGRAEPNELVSLLFKIRNMGNETAESVYTILRTRDTFITIIDSITYFGNILPDSEVGPLDPQIFISPNTPPRWQINFKLIMVARNYLDSANITIQTGGGTATCPIPDNQYIYWAYDNSCSTYTECPRYEWIEIRNIGVRLPINQDDQTIRVKWPFSFRYYGILYNDSLSICSNGWITPMRTTLTSYTNQPLPDPTSTNPSAMICPNWYDLDARRGNGIWFLYDSLNHRIIIEWDSIHYFNPGTQWDKFQIIIYDTTVAGPQGYNKIVFQYKTRNGFTSSTVGIEDSTNTIGINYPQNGIIRERAIRFTNIWPQVVCICEDLRNGKEKDFYQTIIASQIRLNLEKEKEVSIYNLSGSKVKTLKPKEKEFILDIKELPKGIYIINFKKSKKNLKVIKIR
ncbi:MAG: T9SS type A sorting domain-containing protein, partial [candidate division WOR-3 bacterium]|nr:T9SS type A sorting domain-containing protein [candidate division WOR-3 bacterium]